MITINRTVSLDAPITPETLFGAEFTKEQNAHTWVIRCTRGGEALTLTGSVTARILQADGSSAVLNGSIENGAAVLTLPKACYGIPGRFTLAIYNTVTGETEAETVTACIYACTGSILQTASAETYDPTSMVPDAETLQGYIDDLQDALDDATEQATHSVQYTEQTLTTAQQAQARANIGAPAATVTGTTLTLA